MQPQPPKKPAESEQADPSSIPEFDRAMRGLMHVPKAEVDAEEKKRHPKKRQKRK